MLPKKVSSVHTLINKKSMHISFILILSLMVIGWFAYNIFRVKKLIQVSAGIQTIDAYEQHPDSATLRILVAGDSTAVGTGTTNVSQSVAGRIGEDYPTADITNLSQNGRKTGELIEVIQAQNGKQYDLILLQIGGNDIIRFVALPQVANNIDILLTEARKLSDRVILVTSGDVGESPFFPRPLHKLWSKRTKEVRVLFQEASKKHGVQYVDLFGLNVDSVFNTDIPKYYSPDLLHPSEAGYGVWYDYIGPVISKSLDE